MSACSRPATCCRKPLKRHMNSRSAASRQRSSASTPLSRWTKIASPMSFARFTLVATIEEHSRIGGFGSAVAEWLIDQRVDAAALHPLRHAGRLLQAIRRAGIRARGARPQRPSDRGQSHRSVASGLEHENHAALLVQTGAPLVHGGDRYPRAEVGSGAGRDRLFRRLRHAGDGMARRQGRGQMGTALPRP